MSFTIEQIKYAHSKVKSGADFPQYIRDIKQLGVRNYTTYVIDGHTEYFGNLGFQIQSNPKYLPLEVAEESVREHFKSFLKAHQNGESDYLTFSAQAAETGIEKWIVLLDEMTCTYYDKNNSTILTENIPEQTGGDG